jgi:mannose-6-phosphate isomerase-like protein (cupin superfamily)
MLTSALMLVFLFPAEQTKPTTSSQRGAALEVRVTDRSGAVLGGATVRAEGPVPREATTSAEGGATLQNLPTGTYRLRFDREGYVAFEKEVAVKAGAPQTVYAALTPAPPPPKPPPAPVPPPAPAAPVFTAGNPQVIYIPDFADKQLIGNNETTKEAPLGCSGAAATRLLQARAPIAAHTHADADEVLYVVAGEATLALGGKEFRIASGSLVVVPRGMEHGLTRRSSGPVILTSTLSGPACTR